MRTIRHSKRPGTPQPHDASRNLDAPRRSRRAVALCALAGGAASVGLLTLCFPPYNLGWLAWVALVPLLAVLPRLSVRGAEWLGLLVGLAFYAVGFRWFADIFGFPAVALWGLLALFVAAFCVLVRSLPKDLPVWARAFLAASFWVALEFIRAEQWPLRFSWLALGYSQHNQAAILPAAAWVGVYGLSFAIVAVNVWLVSAAQGRRGGLAGALLIAVCMAGALGWDGARTAASLRNEPVRMRVALLQSARADIPRIERMAHAGERESLDLVAWREYAYEMDPRQDPKTWRHLQDLARRHGATLVFGATDDLPDGRYYSAAYVLGPDGAFRGTARKHNPLPFFRDGLASRDYPLLSLPVRSGEGMRSVPFGSLVCFDLSFEYNARALAAKGAALLVVPSVETTGWPRIEQAQHATVAPLRAAENRCTVLRASWPGPSQVVLPTGAVLASLPPGRTGTLAVGDIPVGAGSRTPYNRAGWLLPWLCQGVTVAWVLGRMARPLIEINGRRMREVRSAD